MITVHTIEPTQKDILDKIVDMHIASFKGFFLSSMHHGFLRTLYRSFTEHKSSELLVAFDGDTAVGFIAYSWDTRGIYRYMLSRHFFTFFWYSFLSFVRRPSIVKKLFSALSMPKNSKRDEHYCKIFSIGVDPARHGEGIGSMLIDTLKHRIDFSKYAYITLETDAYNNDYANKFYLDNGMTLSSVFVTAEGRVMNKYHYRVHYENPVS